MHKIAKYSLKYLHKHIINLLLILLMRRGNRSCRRQFRFKINFRIFCNFISVWETDIQRSNYELFEVILIHLNSSKSTYAIFRSHTDSLPYEHVQVNCSSMELICSQGQSSKSKRCQKPTNISTSTLARGKRLNPVQNILHQNGLNNLQSSIDYIRTLLK